MGWTHTQSACCATSHKAPKIHILEGALATLGHITGGPNRSRFEPEGRDILSPSTWQIINAAGHIMDSERLCNMSCNLSCSLSRVGWYGHSVVDVIVPVADWQQISMHPFGATTPTFKAEKLSPAYVLT